MRLTRRLLPAICMAWLAVTASPAGAQEAAPKPWSTLSSPLFSHIGQDEGLPYPVALAMAQDRDGFLWIGTPGGLARWDGYRMRVYRHRSGDPDTLPENMVADLLVDERGQLWVGHVSGVVTRYDPDRDAFVTHRDPGGASGRLRSMTGDGAGGVWTSGSGGLAHLDADGRWTREDAPEVGLVPGEFPAVRRDRKGTLWLGTPQGLMRRAEGAERFEAVPLPAESGPVTPTALFEDGSGNLWFGTAVGQVGVVDGTTGNARLLDTIEPSGQRVSAIAVPMPGVLWIGEYGGGIREMRVRTRTVRAFRHDPQNSASLSDDSVTGMLVDRSGLVWTSSLRGVDRHNPVDHGLSTVLPSAPNGLLGRDVRSMGARADGKVWVGFRSEGIALLDPVAGRVAEMRPGAARGRGLPRQMIQAIAALSNGDVWTGSRVGLHHVVPGSQRVQTFTPLQGASILALLAEEPVLWAGGSMGLARIGLGDGSLRVFTHMQRRADSLSDNSVQALLRDRAGRLWVGTQRGLNLFDDRAETFSRLLHDPADPESLPNDIAITLLEDRRGRLWVGTASGIGILDPGAASGGKPRFRRLGTAQGLPHDTVTMLLEDLNGTIWVGGGDRLAMVDPDTLAVRTFGLVEGAGIRTHWAGSGARLPDGTLLFGGFGGMTVVRPGVQPDVTFRPPVVATEVRVGGRPVPVPADGAPIVVAPEDRHLEVEFAALDFSAPERNRYTYRLEGFDNDWVASEPDYRRATYTGLRPGDYRLLIRGSNREGVWSEPPLQLSVRVLPAWYQTGWFQVALAAAGLALVYAMVQVRTAYLRRRQRVLERQVALRTAEVEAARARALAEEASARRAMEEAEAADRAKSRFLAVVSHEIRTPLNGVLGMLQMLDPRGLDAEQRRRVEIARQSGDTLVSLIESILEYGRYEAEGETVRLSDVDPRRLAEEAVELFRPQAAAKGVPLELEAAEPMPALVRCDQVRITRVLHNLLGNAVKFTARGRIAVSLRCAAGEPGAPATLHLGVADSGIGIAPDLHDAIFQEFVQADDSIARRFGGTGLGLAVSRRIATLLGGSLTVESAVGAGSTFHLSVPVTVVPGAAPALPAATAGGGGTALSVLLVDDDPVNREVGAGLLGRLGYRADMAEGGAAAVRLAAGTAYDLILMDLHMPGIDGIEAIRRIRALPAPAGAGPRFVMMTADVTEDARRRCAQAGVDATLSKPLHLDVLRRALTAAGSAAGSAGSAADAARRDPADCLDLPFVLDQRAVIGLGELVRLTRLFGHMSRRTLADLDEAAAAGDREAVQALAHRLRSAAGAIGLAELATAAGAVESAAARGAAADAALVAPLRGLRRDSLSALFAALRLQGDESVLAPSL